MPVLYIHVTSTRTRTFRAKAKIVTTPQGMVADILYSDVVVFPSYYHNTHTHTARKERESRPGNEVMAEMKKLQQ